MAITKQFSKAKGTCKVTFKLPKEMTAAAVSVKVLGDFNEWNPSSESAEMERLKTGEFKAVLNLEMGQEYQFRYLIDEARWENETEADKVVLSQFGTENSVVVL